MNGATSRFKVWPIKGGRPAWMEKANVWANLARAILSVPGAVLATIGVAAVILGRADSKSVPVERLSVEPAIGPVGSQTLLIGHSTLKGHHYFVVTTPQGTDVVQDDELQVSEDGAVRGSVALGSLKEGAGQEFRVRLVATAAQLAPGPVVRLPAEAVISDPLTLVRRAEGRAEP